MPLLKITESKKVTIVSTIEETTARAVEQYAAWTNGSPDEVIQQALDYVFSRDKDFERYRTEKPGARPKVALRVKRAASSAAVSPSAPGSSSAGTTAAHGGAR